MGLPKKKGPELGKSLQRRSGHGHRTVSSRHTTSTDDGGPAPISITENTSIDEFLSNAEAAQRNFEAERGTAAIAVSQTYFYQHIHLVHILYSSLLLFSKSNILRKVIYLIFI